MKDFYLARTSEPEERQYHIRITGAGAADPTKVRGGGLTITWISTGLYEITWKKNPGVFAGLIGYGFDATTASQLKGYSVVPGDYDSTNRKLRFSVTNASDTLADLTSVQRLTLRLAFAETNIKG